MLALQIVPIAGSAALGGFALALIVLKLVLGNIPAAEARLLPWDAYAHVDGWAYVIPAFFLAGAGLWAARASWWKRDLLRYGPTMWW